MHKYKKKNPLFLHPYYTYFYLFLYETIQLPQNYHFL